MGQCWKQNLHVSCPLFTVVQRWFTILLWYCSFSCNDKSFNVLKWWEKIKSMMFCTCIFGITLVRTGHSIKQPKVVHIIVFKKIANSTKQNESTSWSKKSKIICFILHICTIHTNIHIQLHKISVFTIEHWANSAVLSRYFFVI